MKFLLFFMYKIQIVIQISMSDKGEIQLFIHK